ncbi:MAG: Crp/Fnr family transcriptional regulator [Anaerolineales bacterium]|nr:Crp/Fnr family transcriptional regulator [Anaerolineales bacterium]
MNTKDLFSQNAVFAGLSDDERDRLLRQASLRKYQKGEYLTHAGDIWPYLFFLAEGSISAVKESSEGRSLVAISFKPGEIFWGVSFFHPELTMPVALRVDAPSRTHLWSREQLLPVLLGNGSISWELSRLMVNRMLRASEIVEELAFQPLTGRVARLLLESFPATPDAVQRRLTLDEMAARIGSTREMVCRILSRFAEQGAIRINRTEFVCTDRSILEKHIR